MAAILVLAAALRFAGLGWGLAGKTSFHPDEDKILWQLERMRLGALDLNPKDFGWGTSHTYLVGVAILALDRAGAFGPGWRSALHEGREPYVQRLFMAGRALSALFGLLTVAVVAALAWERAGAGAGLLAAALLAVSPLHVVQSHYLTADVALGFWLALAFWALPRSAAWAGFLTGLAIATKPSALVFAPVLVACVAGGRRRLHALFAVAAGFLVAEPYALLAFPEWWGRSIEIVGRIGAGTPEAFPIGELLARHALQLLLYGLGPVAALVALVGLRSAARPLVMAAGALALTLALSRFPMGRYELPLLPFLAVAFGLALARLPRRLLALALPLSLLPPLAYSAAWVALLDEPHPFQQAASFIETRVPSGATVARLWAEYPSLDPGRYRLAMLEDPFALQGHRHPPLSADVVVLDDLPLHSWRPELGADLAENYNEAARFRRPLALFGLILPEPWAPHDSRYPHPEVTVYERLRPRPARIQRDEGIAARLARRRSGGDGDARVFEVAEDVGAMAARAHPLLDDILGAALSRGQVLADRQVAVAAPADRGERGSPVGCAVIEVAALEHVAQAVFGGRVQPSIEAERRQPALPAVVVHGLEHRVAAERPRGAPRREAVRERGQRCRQQERQRERCKALKPNEYAGHAPHPPIADTV